MGDTAISSEATGASVTALPEIVHVASSDPGLGLEENQDAYTVLETEFFKFFMVADGMGSASHGREIALRALSSVESSLHQESVLDEKIIRKVFEQANRDVLKRAAELKDAVNLATTLLGIAFTAKQAYLVNVGNSRLYRLREGEFTQLSVDHTVEGQLRRGRGEQRPLPAGTRPIGHLLTAALGLSEELEVDVKVLEETPADGDVYLLCTDGLYDVLTEARMRTAFEADAPFKKIARRLVMDARKQSSTDNITALTLKVIAVPESYSKKARSASAKAVEVVARSSQSNEPKASVKVQPEVPVDQILADDDSLVVDEQVEVNRAESGKGEQKSAQIQPQDQKESFKAQGSGQLVDRAAEQERLQRAFNPSTLRRAQDLKSSRAGDPFASSAQATPASSKGTKPFAVPASIFSTNAATTGRYVGGGIVVALIVLMVAGQAGSYLKFQPKGAATRVVQDAKPIKTKVAKVESNEVRERHPLEHSKANAEVDRPGADQQSGELLTEDSLTREEAERLIKLAREVQAAEDVYRYKILLQEKPLLDFDKVSNVELRSLMLNVYAAVQQAIRDGERRAERMSEESIKLAQSVERLSKAIKKFEESRQQVVTVE